MRYSEMSTREQAKLLCKIAPTVSRIAQDKEFNSQLSKIASADKTGKTVFQMVTGLIDACMPLLLDKHYEDTMAICGELLGKTEAEMERAGILAIVREVKAVLDEDLIGFFKQSAVSGMKP